MDFGSLSKRTLRARDENWHFGQIELGASGSLVAARRPRTVNAMNVLPTFADAAQTCELRIPSLSGFELIHKNIFYGRRGLTAVKI
jgi:hypothetical protein